MITNLAARYVVIRLPNMHGYQLVESLLQPVPPAQPFEETESWTQNTLLLAAYSPVSRQ